MNQRQLTAASCEPLLLSLLSSEESYGYAIIQRVRERSGGVLEWNEGMLYPVLHRLERSGLVEARWGSSPEGRRRKYYRTTDAGRRAAFDARTRWRQVTEALDSFGFDDLVGPEAGEGAFDAA